MKPSALTPAVYRRSGSDPVVFGPSLPVPDGLDERPSLNRHCYPCDVKWRGTGTCWNCGRDVTDN